LPKTNTLAYLSGVPVTKINVFWDFHLIPDERVGDLGDDVSPLGGGQGLELPAPIASYKGMGGSKLDRWIDQNHGNKSNYEDVGKLG
jgi:hypothetical protein